MKNLKKKNNKGFSLVELIVVVMIMAILAVALAPQVMKWVGNSRRSADASMYESAYSSLQLAMAQEDVYDEIKNQELIVTLDTTKGLTFATKAAPTTELTLTTSLPDLNTELTSILGTGYAAKFKPALANYKININNGILSRGASSEVPNTTMD